MYQLKIVGLDGLTRGSNMKEHFQKSVCFLISIDSKVRTTLYNIILKQSHRKVLLSSFHLNGDTRISSTDSKVL